MPQSYHVSQASKYNKIFLGGNPECAVCKADLFED